MDKQNKNITELTLDQMDKITGGAGSYDGEVLNNYNTGEVSDNPSGAGFSPRPPYALKPLKKAARAAKAEQG